MSAGTSVMTMNENKHQTNGKLTQKLFNGVPNAKTPQNVLERIIFLIKKTRLNDQVIQQKRKDIIQWTVQVKRRMMKSVTHAEENYYINQILVICVRIGTTEILD